MPQLKLILMLLPLAVYAKGFGQQYEMGFNFGGAAYLGDLNPYQPFKISGISSGVFAKINFDPHWALGLHYNYGKVAGDDANSNNEQFRDRNLSFTTALNEISLLVDFNLFDLYVYNRKTKITPYLFAGLGTIIFDPIATYHGNKYYLRLLSTEGNDPYKGYSLTFPYGAGIKYKPKENWTFFAQLGYRSPLTDLIDDVSGIYPNTATWTGDLAPIRKALSDRSGELTGTYLGTPGTQRGDFRKRDHYMFVGIGISYTFVSQKCFTF